MIEKYLEQLKITVWKLPSVYVQLIDSKEAKQSVVTVNHCTAPISAKRLWRPRQQDSDSMLPFLEKSYPQRKIEGDTLVINQN